MTQIIDNSEFAQALWNAGCARRELASLARQLPGRMLCGTGHRPQDIPGYRDEHFPVLAYLAEQMLVSYRPAVVIAGGAIGWDQALAQAAITLHIPLVLVLPFVGQHRRWPIKDQQRLLDQARAATVAYAHAAVDHDSRSSVVQALMGRNVEMLRWAEMGVLPFHSGKEGGGTHATLQEAAKRGVHVLNNAYALWDEYRAGKIRVLQQLTRTPLSNFAPVELVTKSGTYASVEHAYQAYKTRDQGERAAIATAKTAAEAKALGRKVTLRSDWPRIKLKVMEALLRCKFAVPEYRDHLLRVDADLIVEGNTWGDTFFGVHQGYGSNHLGRLLMQIREELRVQAS